MEYKPTPEEQKFFRFKHKDLDEKTVDRMVATKTSAVSYFKKLNDLPPSRERSLALTHLEMSIMMASKAITE